ncbi:MAG: HEAT repeat domain-containing protein [Planctomycetota bacterium]
MLGRLQNDVLRRQRRARAVSGSLASLALLFAGCLCVGCERQDPLAPSRPTAQADQASVPQSQLTTFDGVFAGIVSRDPRVRKAAFEKFRDNWAAYRRRLQQVPASATLPRRVARAYLLSRLGTQADLPTIRACFDDRALVVRRTALEGLRRLDDHEHLEMLLHRAANEDFDSLVAYLPTWFQVNPIHAERLVMRLARHERWQTRCAAALFLRKCRSDQAHTVLLSLLGDKAWRVTVDACRSVGSMGLVPAAEPLQGLLSHADAPVRAAAIKALGGVGSPTVLEHATRLVHDDAQESVRVAAVQAVAGQPSDKVVPLLATVLERKSEQLKVTKAAIRILVRMSDRQGQELLDKIYATADTDLQQVISNQRRAAAAEVAAPPKGAGR